MVPPLGSTPAAVRVMSEVPSPIAGLGFALAVTPGGVFGGATLIGTVTVAIEGVFTPAWPTVSWNVRLTGADTAGAMNVAVELFGLVIVTCGSTVFTVRIHANGPASGKLP